jgi:hypothetical protein
LTFSQSGTAIAAVTISITNGSDVNIAPQWIAVLPSFEAGVTFFSSKNQKVGDLKSSLSLLGMGTIKPRSWRFSSRHNRVMLSLLFPCDCSIWSWSMLAGGQPGAR